MKTEFELFYNNSTLLVSEHAMTGQVLYRVQFPDKRAPLVLHRAKGEGGRFWTSIPEGRQYEAEQIGQLIESYIKSNH